MAAFPSRTGSPRRALVKDPRRRRRDTSWCSAPTTAKPHLGEDPLAADDGDPVNEIVLRLSA
jgi:hypothetical protein